MKEDEKNELVKYRFPCSCYVLVTTNNQFIATHAEDTNAFRISRKDILCSHTKNTGSKEGP